MDEQTAISRLKQGDIGGLAALVERYEVRAVRAAFLITHDRTTAEDVVQNAFLRAFQRIDQFDNSRPFASWFMRSVVNAAIQAARRNQQTISLDRDVGNAFDAGTFTERLPDPRPGPADEVEMAELRATVWEALAQLSPEQRAVVVLRYYLDLSGTEMADELAVPPGTIRWRLHAARKRLRGLLRGAHGRDAARRWQEEG